MRFLLLLFGVFWFAGSTYWYTCKIKYLCDEPIIKKEPPVVVAPPPQDTVMVRKKATFTKSINIEFDNGKSAYKTHAELEKFLDELAAFLKENPEQKLHLTGHTDDKGTDERNLELGLRRAVAINDALIKRGVAKAQITSDTKGESAPKCDNTTDEGRKCNRRVDFKIL